MIAQSNIANANLFRDFCNFSKLAVASKDIDPVYPMLKRYYQRRGIIGQQAIWHTLLYVTFYHLGSAELMWSKYPHPTVIAKPIKLPTGIERRGFRGEGTSNPHIAAIAGLGDLTKWVEGLAGDGGKRGWRGVQDGFEKLPFVGPWASYKFADLLAHVHDYPITAPDIGTKSGKTAGALPGFVKLTGATFEECIKNVSLQEQVFQMALDAGVPFSGLDQMETALCDFNSLTKGSYYAGHDIDDLMNKLKDSSREWWDIRAEVFDRRYLGELQGWLGVRKHLKSAYQRKGRIVDPGDWE